MNDSLKVKMMTRCRDLIVKNESMRFVLQEIKNLFEQALLIPESLDRCFFPLDTLLAKINRVI